MRAAGVAVTEASPHLGLAVGLAGGFVTLGASLARPSQPPCGGPRREHLFARVHSM